jgi:hypothetical protein
MLHRATSRAGDREGFITSKSGNVPYLKKPSLPNRVSVSAGFRCPECVGSGESDPDTLPDIGKGGNALELTHIGSLPKDGRIGETP